MNHRRANPLLLNQKPTRRQCRHLLARTRAYLIRNKGMGIKKTPRAYKTTVGTIGVSAFSYHSITYSAEGLEQTIGNHRHQSTHRFFRYYRRPPGSGSEGRVFALAVKVLGRFGSGWVLAFRFIRGIYCGC